MTKVQKVSSDFTQAAALLASEKLCVWDWETSGNIDKSPTTVRPVGLALYFPTVDRLFYINCRSPEPSWPFTTAADLAPALSIFFNNPACHAIGHNIQFDMLVNYRLGVDQRCRVSDTLVLVHRVNENLGKDIKEVDAQASWHNIRPIGYGLKTLTQLIRGEVPITLKDISPGGVVNTEATRIDLFGGYAANDALNTWAVYEWAMAQVREQGIGRWIKFDEASFIPIIQMMSVGIPIDAPTIKSQISFYESYIARCDKEIERLSGGAYWLDKKVEQYRLLKKTLGYNAANTSREYLENQFISCSDHSKRILSHFIARSTAKQRKSRFLEKTLESLARDGRAYLTRFESTTDTTRFKAKPNWQSLPKKAEKPRVWAEHVANDLKSIPKTRAIIKAPDGYCIIACDLSNAEPRYCASKMQDSLQKRGSDLEAIIKMHRDTIFYKLGDLIEWKNRFRAWKPNKPPPIEYPKLVNDPLWEAFNAGLDPYMAIATTVQTNREIAKQLWLSIIYGKQLFGAQAQLLPQLHKNYPMLPIIHGEIEAEMKHTGMVHNLWGRPRRIQGFYQFALGEPVEVVFKLQGTLYSARIIPLQMIQFGIQAFVQECWRREDGGIVLRADRAKQTFEADWQDPFVQAPHYVLPPFRDISYKITKTVTSADGICYPLFEWDAAVRKGFNSVFQATGSDHMRWLITEVQTKLLPKFSGVELFLSVHDELLFLCPKAMTMPFMRAAHALITTPPNWCTVPVLSEFKYGETYSPDDLITIKPEDLKAPNI